MSVRYGLRCRVVEASQAVLQSVEGTGGFCRGKTILWQSRKTGSETAHLGTLWLEYDMFVCMGCVTERHIWTQRAAIFQKSLDGNQPTDREHYSSVASALLPNP